MFIHQNERSFRIIITPIIIRNRKKIVSIHAVILKNFSSLKRKTFWIIKAQNFQPSNAGIGRIFMIAKATDIIPANQIKLKNHRLSNNSCPTFTIATGHERELIACFVSPFQINQPTLAKELIVRFHSALISFNASRMAFGRENFIVGIS